MQLSGPGLLLFFCALMTLFNSSSVKFVFFGELKKLIAISSGISENNSRNHYDECACMHLFSSCEKKNISDASK